MTTTKPQNKIQIWVGRILKSLVALFLFLDAIMKVIRHSEYVKGTIELGLPESSVLPLGIYLLSGTILYSLPRTSFIGAVLITAYLGGAVAITYSAANEGHPYLFPVIFAALLWVSEYFTSKHFRSLIRSVISNS